MADANDSKSFARKGMWVRLPPAAHLIRRLRKNMENTVIKNKYPFTRYLAYFIMLAAPLVFVYLLSIGLSGIMGFISLAIGIAILGIGFAVKMIDSLLVTEQLWQELIKLAILIPLVIYVVYFLISILS